MLQRYVFSAKAELQLMQFPIGYPTGGQQDNKNEDVA